MSSSASVLQSHGKDSLLLVHDTAKLCVLVLFFNLRLRDMTSELAGERYIAALLITGRINGLRFCCD